jgi:hypothetical protein
MTRKNLIGLVMVVVPMLLIGYNHPHDAKVFLSVVAGGIYFITALLLLVSQE